MMATTILSRQPRGDSLRLMVVTDYLRELAMNVKQLVENNAGVFAMTLVITGFLAGVACYESIMRIADLTTISKSKMEELTTTIQADIQSRAASNLKLAEKDFDLKKLSHENDNLKVQLARNELGRLDGIWVNEDPNTRGITRFSIEHRDAEIFVHAWGKCHPTDCDWGEQKALVDKDSAVVLWDQKFALDRMVVKLNTSSKLIIDEVTMIGDARGRLEARSTFLFQSPLTPPMANTESTRSVDGNSK